MYYGNLSQVVAHFLAFLKQSILKVVKYCLYVFGELLNDSQYCVLEFSCLLFRVCLSAPLSTFIPLGALFKW